MRRLSPACVAVSPSGRFAYVSNVDSFDVTTFGIDPLSGALTEVGTETAAQDFPFSMCVDPSGRFAYVANAGAGSVTTFSIDPTSGTLAEVGTPVPAGQGPRSIVAIGVLE